MAMFLKSNIAWLHRYHERHPVCCPSCRLDVAVEAGLSIVAKSPERGSVTLTCPACHRSRYTLPACCRPSVRLSPC